MRLGRLGGTGAEMGGPECPYRPTPSYRPLCYNPPFLSRAGIGLLVFSLFLVYDTQLIIGGKHREYAYGPDDYVIAALNVYMDVIQIFLYL